jgi:transposase
VATAAEISRDPLFSPGLQGGPVEDKACRCCCGTLIGEDRAEMLDYVPAQVRVRVIRRPRYGCRACEEAVVQALAPDLANARPVANFLL